MTKTLPKSEDGHGVHYITPTAEHVISQNTTKQQFTLWQIVDGGYEKISTANNPLKLYEKIEKSS